MKKLITLFCLFMLVASAYSLTMKTGTATIYFPVDATMVANKSGDRSSSFVTKISKAQGYSDNTYELQLTSADWVGGTVFPVTFTYLVKPGTKLQFKKCSSIYSNFDLTKFVVKSVKENEIELEEDTGNYKEITTSEDTL